MFANDMTVTGVNIQNTQQVIQANIKKQTVLSKMGIKPKLTFYSREDIQIDGQQTHEEMLNTASHQRKQIKTKMRHHFIPVTLIKKTTNNKCWRGCGEERALIHCPWECNWIQPLWKTVEALQKLKTEPRYDAAILLLGISLQKTGTLI